MHKISTTPTFVQKKRDYAGLAEPSQATVSRLIAYSKAVRFIKLRLVGTIEINLN
jgi:hypothetical protein